MIGETEKGATQVLNKPTKQEDQLEAAPSFYLITQGIKFHQHAESKHIPPTGGATWTEPVAR